MATKAFSREDGNLQTASIVTTRTKVYKDLDLVFGDTASGDVFKKTDAAAVKQAVKNLLMTNYLEKPFRPNYGGNLNDFLFENADFFDASEIEDQVFYAVQNYEPRARVESVEAKVLPQHHDVKVTVTFRIINTNEVISIDLSLARLR